MHRQPGPADAAPESPRGSCSLVSSRSPATTRRWSGILPAHRQQAEISETGDEVVRHAGLSHIVIHNKRGGSFGRRQTVQIPEGKPRLSLQDMDVSEGSGHKHQQTKQASLGRLLLGAAIVHADGGQLNWIPPGSQRS